MSREVSREVRGEIREVRGESREVSLEVSRAVHSLAVPGYVWSVS